MAVFVLALTVLGAQFLLGTLLRAESGTRLTTLGTGAAHAKLDELRAVPFGDVVAGTDTLYGVSRAWTVSATGDVKFLSVSATWTDIDGISREVALRGLVTR